jgi:hypothetical protein
VINPISAVAWLNSDRLGHGYRKVGEVAGTLRVPWRRKASKVVGTLRVP